MKNETKPKKENAGLKKESPKIQDGKKFRKGEKVPIVYKDITSEAGAELLESCIKFKLPEGGIHKPCVWRSRDSWGASYRIFARVDPRKISGAKFTKHLLISLKWKGQRDLLRPATGQESILKTIDVEAANYLKQLLN